LADASPWEFLSNKCLQKYSINGIEFVLVPKNGFKKLQKNNENHLRRNNYMYEVGTAVARCFPNILDILVLENINLSEDEIGRPPLWSNETVEFFSSVGYIGFQQCKFQPHVNFICICT
jgi:hypothetical protein